MKVVKVNLTNNWFNEQVITFTDFQIEEILQSVSSQSSGKKTILLNISIQQEKKNNLSKIQLGTKKTQQQQI